MRQEFIAAAVFAAGLGLLSPAQAAGSRPAASADGPRIGVVDFQQVINSSHRGQAANEEFKKLYSDLNAQLEDRKKKLLDVKTQLDKADSKSPDYQKLLKSYEDGQQELQQVAGTMQQDLNQRRQELLVPIQQELVGADGNGGVLKRFAKDSHYDIIFTKGGAAAYASDAYDVTSALVEAMDKDWAELQKAQAATPAPAATTKK